MMLRMLGAEIRRSTRLARSYWLEYVADLVLYTIGFLLLISVFRAASDDYGPQEYLSSLIGYTIWKICASMLVEIARIASEEARTGTLEQLFLMGSQTGSVFIARSVGIMLNHGVRGLLLAFLLAAILGITLPISLTSILIFCLTLVGAAGLGFALAGLVLVQKRMGGMLQLLWQLLVFFTGALAPIYNPLFAVIAKVLPLSWGITCLRAIFLEGASISLLWQERLLIGLLVNTFVYIALGFYIFNWGQRAARQMGVLAHY